MLIDYWNLYTIDILCHGVPSPGVFKKYVNYIENAYGDKITRFKFRSKKYSWKYFNTEMKTINKPVYIGTYFKDPWLQLFLRNNILRTACYSCKYTTVDRCSDLTIGDFWDYRKLSSFHKADLYGVSMIIINSLKGRKLFDQCGISLEFTEATLDEAIVSSRVLRRPFDKPDTREEFWIDYSDKPFSEIIDKWMQPTKPDLRARILSENKGDQLSIINKLIVMLVRIKQSIRYRIRKLMSTV